MGVRDRVVSCKYGGLECRGALLGRREARGGGSPWFIRVAASDGTTPHESSSPASPVPLYIIYTRLSPSPRSVSPILTTVSHPPRSPHLSGPQTSGSTPRTNDKNTRWATPPAPSRHASATSVAAGRAARRSPVRRCTRRRGCGLTTSRYRSSRRV